MISGEWFYRSLVEATEQVEQELRSAGIEGTLGIVIYAGKTYRGNFGPEIRLEISYPGPKSQVEGRDLVELTEELIRRHQFQNRQQQKQLLPPPVEHAPQPSALREAVESLDDEIPF